MMVKSLKLTAVGWEGVDSKCFSLKTGEVYP